MQCSSLDLHFVVYSLYFLEIKFCNLTRAEINEIHEHSVIWSHSILTWVYSFSINESE